MMQKKYIAYFISGILLLLLPILISDQYISHVVSILFLYIIMAIGLSIVVSYAGLLDLGYVAFFAVGAYFYALLNTAFNFPFLAAIPLAALCAALFGLILGFPTLRVRGDYLALVTLAFGEMIRMILTNWTSLTNGPKGIYAIDGPGLPGIYLQTAGQYYYVVLICLAVAILLHNRLTRSSIALIWESLRDDETASKSSGINPQKYYLTAFAIGASFAGVVGVLFASIQKFVSPESFVLDESILVLSIVVLSGGKSVWRIALAATIFYLVPELLRGFKEYRLLIFGGFLIFFPIYEDKLNTFLNRFFTKKDNNRDISPKVIAGGQYSPPKRTDWRILLHVKNLLKEFDGVKAINNVSFEKVFSKNIIALIGPNGAGKTTLFNCLSGLEQPTGGTINFADKSNITKLKPHQIALAGVGRTFQNVRLFNTMTAFDNVLIGSFCGKKIPHWSALLGTKAYKIFINARTGEVEYYLKLLGIEEYRKEIVSALPLGVQRKIEIARALATEPILLLLDEAASGLNDAEKKELADILKLITNDLGLSILIVEHDMPFVLGLSEQVIVLDSGSIIAEGTPEEISNNQKVITAYLGTANANG